MKKITWIPTDGPITTEERKTNPTLGELQKYVGGLIDLVYVFPDGKKKCEMYVNDEGLLNHLPVNRKASDLFSRGLPGYQELVGPCVMVENVHAAASKFKKGVM